MYTELGWRHEWRHWLYFNRNADIVCVCSNALWFIRHKDGNIRLKFALHDNFVFYDIDTELVILHTNVFSVLHFVWTGPVKLDSNRQHLELIWRFSFLKPCLNSLLLKPYMIQLRAEFNIPHEILISCAINRPCLLYNECNGAIKKNGNQQTMKTPNITPIDLDLAISLRRAWWRPWKRSTSLFIWVSCCRARRITSI